ncbi:MAG: glycosyltransferase family 39 protein [Fimbriiglobus sp.]|jgi:hypothetical protein|nr:glycosyltransferase family 39 protein [Fimbriiglobus sp.]
MPLFRDSSAPPDPATVHHVPVSWGVFGAAVVVCFTLFNAAYVGWWCPHDLAPDEAHYWDWSRRLDYGYYSKGPLIAWLIRAGCTLFGDTPFGVRSVAVTCCGLLLLGLWRLCLDATKNEQIAFGVLLSATTLPLTTAVGVVSTIDGPFLACWAWATVATLRKRWTLAGWLVTVGTLAKPTMLLFPACVALLLVVHPEWRTRRVWAFFVVSPIGLLPLLAWNAAHDWVSVRHLFGHAGNGGDPAPWYSPLAFVGGQFALLLGGWFVLWVVAAWRVRPGRASSASTCLWCLSVPVFGVFLLMTVRTTGEVNWPAPAYIGGAVLIAMWLSETTHRWRMGMVCLISLGLLGSVVVRWPGLVRPQLAAMLAQPTENHPTPVRRLDPTARLAGWRTLAKAVDEVRNELGEPAELVAMAWNVPGELAFYCAGQPTVYTFAPAVGDRFSQYDLWRPNPVADAQAFRGKTFVYVGTELPHGVFDRIERVRRVTATDGGVPVATWDVWVGRGFRGFGSPLHRPRY